MLTSNVVIWSPLLNSLPPPPPPDWSRLQLIRAPTSRSRAILLTFSRFLSAVFCAISLKLRLVKVLVRLVENGLLQDTSTCYDPLKSHMLQTKSRKFILIFTTFFKLLESFRHFICLSSLQSQETLKIWWYVTAYFLDVMERFSRD